LYSLEDEVSDSYYTVPFYPRLAQIGKGRKGIVAASYMVPLACQEEPDATVIDLRCLRPMDGKELVLAVFRNSDAFEVWGTDWVPYGVTAEVVAWVAEEYLEVKRKGLVDCPAPTSWALESQYYGTEGLPGECIPGRVEGPF